jgi:lysozyme family protein
MTDDEVIDIVLQFEGGFVNNPNDHGGPTNFGITAADLGRFLKQTTPATEDQVRKMTAEQARAIYRKWYIDEPGFSDVTSSALKLVLIDSSVLFGVGRATRWLQQALNMTVDGDFGDKTKEALDAVQDQTKLARKVLGLRLQAIANIVSKDTSQLVFLRGWINRAVTLLQNV